MRIGFAVSATGTVTALELSRSVSEAYDILVAGGVSPDRAAGLARACERGNRDPVAWARHFIRVRASMAG